MIENEQLKDLEELFLRDLDRLHREIEKVRPEHLWKTKEGVGNSCGVLVQHITGNLKHFIGTALGQTGYERNRELEFTDTGISGEELMREVEETKEMISEVFEKMEDKRLKSAYPLDIPFDYSVFKFLLHLYGHLEYHMGQLNYLRRILDKNKS